jgi:hypothetical protein
MEGLGYLDFDLRFAKTEKGYSADILQSPAGTAHGAFRLPFQDMELENYLLKIGQRRAGMRKIDSPENRAAREFGSKLFESVFQGDLQATFRKSFEAARAGDHGLRIRLHLGDTPELADLPWEYLWQPQRREFLALSNETPVVRYFDLPETVKPLAVKPPLRVLVMLSNPSDVDCLDVEKEWQKLNEALGYLEASKRLIVERLEKATLGNLQRRLRKNEYHVFHFVGHGSFDPMTEESVLALEDEDGRKRLVSGPDLGIYLRDEPSLRLVLLNACEGARASRTDPFSGAAQSLVLKGIPAVIAMQFEVSDEAAIAMASGFYAALADDYPVDAALAEARKAVFAADCSVEWGTPVLYLRAPDGRIFDVDKSAAPKIEAPARPAPPPPPLPIPPAPVVVRPEPEHAVPAIRERKRRSRPWLWMLSGMVLMFIALVTFGVWLNEKEKREKEKAAAEDTSPPPAATATPTIESTPLNTYGTPPLVEKNVYAGSQTKSRDEEVADTKQELQKLSEFQQKSSKVLDDMHAQALNSIRNIKADSAPEPAGTEFQPSGWWKATVTQPQHTVSRVYFQSNGRFSGTVLTNNTSISGTWSYHPSTSMLAVTYDDGSWLRLPLVKQGDGFQGSLVQDGTTFQMSLEKE